MAHDQQRLAGRAETRDQIGIVDVDVMRGPHDLAEHFDLGDVDVAERHDLQRDAGELVLDVLRGAARGRAVRRARAECDERGDVCELALRIEGWPRAVRAARGEDKQREDRGRARARDT